MQVLENRFNLLVLIYWFSFDFWKIETTVIDCLHTFCKSCLLKYFDEGFFKFIKGLGFLKIFVWVPLSNSDTRFDQTFLSSKKYLGRDLGYFSLGLDPLLCAFWLEKSFSNCWANFLVFLKWFPFFLSSYKEGNTLQNHLRKTISSS